MSTDGGYRTYAGEDLVTGEGVSVEVPVASVPSRVASRLIDLVITVVLALGSFFVVGMLVGGTSDDDAEVVAAEARPGGFPTPPMPTGGAVRGSAAPLVFDSPTRVTATAGTSGDVSGEES